MHITDSNPILNRLMLNKIQYPRVCIFNNYSIKDSSSIASGITIFQFLDIPRPTRCFCRKMRVSEMSSVEVAQNFASSCMSQNICGLHPFIPFWAWGSLTLGWGANTRVGSVRCTRCGGTVLDLLFMPRMKMWRSDPQSVSADWAGLVLSRKVERWSEKEACNSESAT